MIDSLQIIMQIIMQIILGVAIVIIVIPCILWVWFYFITHAIMTVVIDFNFKRKGYVKKEKE